MGEGGGGDGGWGAQSNSRYGFSVCKVRVFFQSQKAIFGQMSSYSCANKIATNFGKICAHLMLVEISEPNLC